MRDAIIQKLQAIEEKEQVSILYAVESGSRGWGFASTDSDYDVRFIYAHPLNWYLSIENKRDVIEDIDSVLDISGWDIRKALQLFKKSNPPLYEWLTSPIVYKEDKAFVKHMQDLMPLFYSPLACLSHYLHMAQGNYREYLEGNNVKVKKYFYVLRPILACMWIAEKKTMPPMEFEKLLRAQTLDAQLLREIELLLERKRRGDELAVENKIEVINDFLEEQLAYFEEHVKSIKAAKYTSTEILDTFFRDTVKKYDLNGR